MERVRTIKGIVCLIIIIVVIVAFLVGRLDIPIVALALLALAIVELIG